VDIYGAGHVYRVYGVNLMESEVNSLWISYGRYVDRVYGVKVIERG
jgi:hypothetical protein